MKKILLSLIAITAVGAIAFAGTRAFFSDTETSKDNVFTAGAIDLKVDHTMQVYNNIDCKTCSVLVVSDTSNEVISTLSGTDSGPFPHPAKLVSVINPAWTANIPGASWIWSQDPTPEAEKGIDTIYTFEKKFNWMGPATGATLNLNIGADNSYEVFLNGIKIGGDLTEQNYNSAGQDTISGTPISSNLIQGENTLRFVVKNWLRPVGQTWDNPGGLIYKLEINSNCDNDYFKTTCRLWQSKDLDKGDVFYNFNDIKPGDWGVNVISLNVTSNDAYACLLPKITLSDDNEINEPESEYETLSTQPKGEIEDQSYFFAWLDLDSDGVWDGGDETALTGNPVLASTFLTNSLPLFIQGSPLIAGQTKYLGIAWCAGTMANPIVGNPFNQTSCNGSGMNNAAQTDKLMTDLSFYVEQVRNNDQFVCPTPTNAPVSTDYNGGNGL